jgi:hypothetical protein
MRRAWSAPNPGERTNRRSVRAFDRSIGFGAASSCRQEAAPPCRCSRPARPARRRSRPCRSQVATSMAPARARGRPSPTRRRRWRRRGLSLAREPRPIPPGRRRRQRDAPKRCSAADAWSNAGMDPVVSRRQDSLAGLGRQPYDSSGLIVPQPRGFGAQKLRVGRGAPSAVGDCALRAMAPPVGAADRALASLDYATALSRPGVGRTRQEPLPAPKKRPAR